MKKKLTCVVFSALMAASSLVACNRNSGPADDFVPALDTNRECTLNVIGDYGNFKALENEFDKFDNYYKNVKLVYTKVSSYEDNLASKLEGDNKINIFFATSAMLVYEKFNTVVSHMEDLSDPALNLNLDCIRDGLITPRSDNKVLLAPIFSRTFGMLVNEDLFQKENLTIPTKWSDLLTTSSSFISKECTNPIMGFSKNSSSCLMNSIAYPSFVVDLANAENPNALTLANKLDSSAGEYMRNSLTKVKTLIDNNYVNITECNKINDNYEQVILRFFKGDVPMMICTADTVSGTSSRESKSPEFVANPFKYSFHPIPLTEQGGYFIDSPTLEFAVNKNCENLDMTNEFMRFLLRPQQLNSMATSKGLMTPVKNPVFDPVYNAFNNFPLARTYTPEALGVKDPLSIQIRNASFDVGKGNKTIEDAIAYYGQYATPTINED